MSLFRGESLARNRKTTEAERKNQERDDGFHKLWLTTRITDRRVSGRWQRIQRPKNPARPNTQRGAAVRVHPIVMGF
jgi:hypothetical protein